MLAQRLKLPVVEGGECDLHSTLIDPATRDKFRVSDALSLGITDIVGIVSSPHSPERNNYIVHFCFSKLKVETLKNCDKDKELVFCKNELCLCCEDVDDIIGVKNAEVFISLWNPNEPVFLFRDGGMVETLDRYYVKI